MSSIKAPAIKPGSLVLVTGVNGYVGSHIADQLLTAGYRVRGTVRSFQKAAWMDEFFRNKYGEGKFQLVAVPDFTIEGALDEAVKDASGVAHTANSVAYACEPQVLIREAVVGTLSALISASKECSVKRFVFTSSVGTLIVPPKPNVPYTVDQNTWNMEAVEAASSDNPMSLGPWTAYCASKTLAEQQAWKFVNEQKPGFVLNTVLPSLCLGAVLDHEHQGWPSSSVVLQRAFEGDNKAIKFMLPQYFIDVQDVARLHVAALVDPEVQNERIFASAEPVNGDRILDAFLKLFPGRKFWDEALDARDLGEIPTERGAELLRRLGRPGYVSLEETIIQNTKGLV